MRSQRHTRTRGVETMKDPGRDEVAITVQLEPWEDGDASYVSLSRNDLANISKAMRSLLISTGLRAKDRDLIYDYNTSLSTLAMSRVFAPGLEEGVCEAVDCVAICTDGLSELAARSAYVFAQWQPETLMIRSDLVAPFWSNLKVTSLKESDPNLRTVLVLHNDAAPWPRKTRLGPGDFSRLLLHRLDPALFMCVIKPCGGLRYPESFYSVRCEGERKGADEESRQGRLAIRPNFTKGAKTFLSGLTCGTFSSRCECGEMHEFQTERLAL